MKVNLERSVVSKPKKIKGLSPLQEIKKNWVLYLMFVPIAVFFIIFSYIPMTGIVMAFKEFNYRDGIFMSPWNGLENFEYFFQSGKAWIVTKNTILYNVVFLGLYTLFSILVAVLLSETYNKFFKKTAQTLMFLPYFISWVTVSAFVYNFFNYEFGIANVFLRNLGLEAMDIYSTESYWYLLLPLLYVWKWVGFGSVLYLAAIVGIDQEIYEAATIDGASRFQKIMKITLPLLKPTAVVLILLGLGRVMRGEFDMFYQLIGNNGALMNATDIIDTLVFRSLMGTQDFGMASSVGLYQSVLTLIIILIANYLVRRYDKENALF
ncbi:sugar ABC transporter permease [Paenibacillus sp. Root52]|uniref:Aldouronate transport system permease protein n=1 Tax=Paenibacillus amylolyticus TaxID=1451 RepID=A0AAP5GYU2_PAEAM|nr:MULTISPECIES: ABC transporter permease subunit [Paenibacillus]KQY94384.1 sugar ABC transporter permease [Paenibacillus sp. Root52]MDR6721633.1 putative aldouronate transport system permease protein [Paenibacillus amylolyticus]